MAENNGITKQDLDASNAMAQTLTLETAPKALMSAFNGVTPTVLVNAAAGKQPTVAGVPDQLVTDEAPSASDSPTRGLILTEDNIIDIKRYVWNGLKLSTDRESVIRDLGYDQSFDGKKYPEIAPEAFVNLHTQIKGNCAKWSDLEAAIKMQGTSLKIFGEEFVTTGNGILEAIEAMPVIERVKKSLAEYGGEGKEYKFNADDVEIKGGLLELLGTITEAAQTRKDKAHDLAVSLAGYRGEMENQIVPSVNKMNQTLEKFQKSDEVNKLFTKKAELDKEIDTLTKEYNKLVGYAFTGAAGLALGPLGIISWAITGGIFGDKAECIRKKRCAREKERDDIIHRLDAGNALMKFVTSTHSSVSKQCAVLDKALVGVKNLEVMWDAVVQYVDEAAKKLSEIDESKRLLLFQNQMKGAVHSWSEVRDITGELIGLFERAAQRAKEMGLETK